MRKPFFLYSLIFCLSLICAGIASAADVTEVDSRITVGDNAIAAYHLDINNIQKSIESYKSALEFKCNPQSDCKASYTEAMIKLARANSLYGDIVAKSDSEKDRYYEQGKNWAGKALALNPNSAQAHMWYFVNYGKVLKHKDMFTAMGGFGELKSHIFRAYEIDPNDAMITDALGVFYRDIPDIMGRDMTKSESYIRKAVALNPNYARAQRELAQTLYELKHYKEAKEAAEKVLAIASPSDVAAWTVLDKPKAQELLKEINGKI